MPGKNKEAGEFRTPGDTEKKEAASARVSRDVNTNKCKGAQAERGDWEQENQP